jgi:hypothetical protein
MRTVTEAVHELIIEMPYLEEALAQELINLSALARNLQPRVEALLMKPVTEGALVMALRRMAPRLRRWRSDSAGPLRHLRDLTVRSDLVELTFLGSDRLLERQGELLREIRHRTHRFITFTQGVYEVTVILDAELMPIARQVFAGEQVLASLTGLSAITIRLAEESVMSPGVHYSILKQLAMRDINVVEVVSTYTELTVILDRDQVDRAFSVLMG